MSTDVDTPVLIVGAGPVGLALAIDLAQRGVAATLVDRLAEPTPLPKMERINPRTMEYFRSLGVADQVRSAGLPEDLPMDVYVCETLFAEPLVHHPQPSVREMRLRGYETNDGSVPLETYQLTSQYTLEPLLRAIAQELSTRRPLFVSELVAFEQTSSSVLASLRLPDGSTEKIAASYMIGCDGAASMIRRSLGVKLKGNPELLNIYQGLLRCDELYGQLPHKGRHYHILDPHQSFLIVQDDTKHFTLHSMMRSADEMTDRFEQVLGTQLNHEVLYAGPWTMRAMLADSYGRGRVHLAGDAAHLMPPAAGLGMNTGVGDAINLAWKLEAVVKGWAPARLLESYERERRPVGAANIAYSLARFRARQAWRAALRPEELAVPDRRRQLAVLIDQNEARAGDMEGVELGYRYTIPAAEPDEAGPEDLAANSLSEGIQRRYRPLVKPGFRLPHVWLAPGQTAVQDIVPRSSFTLLCLKGREGSVDELVAAFADDAVPLSVLEVEQSAVRRVYGYGYVLVRPDLHIVWCGDEWNPDSDPHVAIAGWIGADAYR